MKIIGKVDLKNDQLHTAVAKEIIIDDGMSFIIKIHGRIIEHDKLGIESNSSLLIQNLEDAIAEFVKDL